VCSATEVILFEKTTFLVIATSYRPDQLQEVSQNPSAPSRGKELDPSRYERTSELIKECKHACMRVQAEFNSLEMMQPDFTAVLEEMTKNTYVMIIVHDPTIGSTTPHFCG
jgi:Ras-related GTP-binding protein A/B